MNPVPNKARGLMSSIIKADRRTPVSMSYLRFSIFDPIWTAIMEKARITDGEKFERAA